MRLNTASNRSDNSNGKLPSSDFTLLKLPQPEKISEEISAHEIDKWSFCMLNTAGCVAGGAGSNSDRGQESGDAKRNQAGQRCGFC
jgi:hypothetical protein